MLSEESKQGLRETFQFAVVAERAMPDVFGGALTDPVNAIQGVIDCDKRDGFTEMVKHLEDNREEAELFMAGLMGMM